MAEPPVLAPDVPDRYGRPNAASRRWIGPLTIIPAAIAVLALLIPGVLRASNRPTDRATALAEKNLAAAVLDVPFQIRQPVFAAGGPALVNAIHEEPRRRSAVEDVADWHKVTTWWNLPGATATEGGNTIKVWQTNDTFVGREVRDDPTRFGGEIETIDGVPWTRAVEDRVNFGQLIVFSHRFDDGITISIDSTDPDLAQLAIRALRPVPGSPPPTAG